MEKIIQANKTIGNNLKRLRTEHGFSQEKVCVKLQCRGIDIGRTTYAKYEAGETNMKSNVITELQKLYNCSIEDFFDGAEK